MKLIEPFHFTNFLANYCVCHQSAFCLQNILFSQLCDDNWNQTLVIPLASSGKNDDHSNEIIYTLTPIGKKTPHFCLFIYLFTFNASTHYLFFSVKSFFHEKIFLP